MTSGNFRVININGMTFLNDPIKVDCRFENGQVKPLSFEWRARPYPILRTIFHYQSQQGSEPIQVFSCQTASGIFDLVFNLKTLSWRIKAFHQPT